MAEIMGLQELLDVISQHNGIGDLKAIHNRQEQVNIDVLFRI